MPILNAKIVMRSINIGGDDTGEVTSVFFGIGAVHGVDQTFCVRVAFIGGMGRAIMKHGFINGVGCFVGKDTG